MARLGGIALVAILSAVMLTACGDSGSGTVDFGTGVDNSLNIQGQTDTFNKGDQITFVAHLSDKLGENSATVVIAKKLGSQGAEQTVESQTLSVSNPDDNVLSDHFSSSGLDSGDYELRINNSSSSLASGTFHIR